MNPFLLSQMATATHAQTQMASSLIELEPNVREQIVKRLGANARAADCKLAEELILFIRRLPGATGACVIATPPAADTGSASSANESKFRVCVSSALTFDVCLTHVRWLTRAEMNSIFALSPGERIASVVLEPREQRLLVRAYFESTAMSERVRTEFVPLAAARRKQLQSPIDWVASGVTNSDDQACLGKLLDEVYNMQDRLPLPLPSWIEPVVLSVERAATTTTTNVEDQNKAANEDDSSSSSSSSSSSAQVYYHANASPASIIGFHLRLRRLPGMSSAFLNHLAKMFGPRLFNYVWYSADNNGNKEEFTHLLQMARTTYGASVGESLIKGSLATCGETELLLTIVSSSSSSSSSTALPSQTSSMVMLRSHPATEAPYTRAAASIARKRAARATPHRQHKKRKTAMALAH